MGTNASSSSGGLGPSIPPITLSARTLDAVADMIKEGRAKRIVVMNGAGISTAAGIPDFRTPGTGLYDNLQRFNLDEPEDVFSLSYFRQRPEPFYELARELYPGKHHPTISHAFVSLLASRGILAMQVSQNIDCLERAARVPPEKLIEAHGSFAAQRCIDCKVQFPGDRMRSHIEAGEVPRCLDAQCGGLVKPDIVFFEEGLPRSFFEFRRKIADVADLVIVLGTSLQVHPFAYLPEDVNMGTPRLLINNERVGRLGQRPDDVLELGSCDAGVRKLAEKLGWTDLLEALWRDLVGEAEMERQMAAAAVSGRRGDTDLDDEINKALTEGVESVMQIKIDESSDDYDDLMDAIIAKAEALGVTDGAGTIFSAPSPSPCPESEAREPFPPKAGGSANLEDKTEQQTRDSPSVRSPAPSGSQQSTASSLFAESQTPSTSDDGCQQSIESSGLSMSTLRPTTDPFNYPADQSALDGQDSANITRAQNVNGADLEHEQRSREVPNETTGEKSKSQETATKEDPVLDLGNRH